MHRFYIALYMLLGLPVAIGMMGCEEEPKWKSRVYVERTSSATSGEVPVPKALWAWLTEPDKPIHKVLDLNTEPTPDQGGGKSAIAKAIVETDLVPLSVYLIEESKGVLGGRNQKIVFGPGGGELDLRDFVVESRGLFRIVFEFAPDLDPKSPRRVWYLSNAERRKVGRDWVGAGCNRYMDISSTIQQANKIDGVSVAVSGDRHVSALAGTFYFSAKRAGRVEVSRLTILDSSKRALHCH